MHSKQFDLWLTAADSCMTFDRAMHYPLVRPVLPNKFDISKATWPLNDLWWGRFENILSKLGGSTPYYSSVPRSMTKCIIALHRPTPIQIHRVQTNFNILILSLLSVSSHRTPLMTFNPNKHTSIIFPCYKAYWHTTYEPASVFALKKNCIYIYE